MENSISDIMIFKLIECLKINHTIDIINLRKNLISEDNIVIINKMLS